MLTEHTLSQNGCISHVQTELETYSRYLRLWQFEMKQRAASKQASDSAEQ